jgi:hypothetical protein
VVSTTTNSVVFNVLPVQNFNPARSPGTGLLPGSVPVNPLPNPSPFLRYNDYVEAWRARQRRTGRTDPPIRPLAGHRPPNWFGWRQVAPGPNTFTMIGPNAAGTVLADGENVQLVGSGTATIIQAFSV